MKSNRQAKIMEIISTTNVETQEQLLRELQNAGFASTQATISRDIKELRIVKELTSFGTYRYTTAAREVPNSFLSRLNTIFRECVTNFDYAQNTHPAGSGKRRRICPGCHENERHAWHPGRRRYGVCDHARYQCCRCFLR